MEKSKTIIALVSTLISMVMFVLLTVGFFFLTGGIFDKSVAQNSQPASICDSLLQDQSPKELRSRTVDILKAKSSQDLLNSAEITAYANCLSIFR